MVFDQNVDCSRLSVPRDLQIVYYVSLGVSAVVWLVFVAYGFLSRAKHTRKILYLGNILSLLQVFLYVTLLLGQGSFYDVNRDLCIPWVRWAVYILSCGPLLAYEIAEITAMPVMDTVLFVVTVSLTLLTGALSAASSTQTSRWTWFGFGFAPYLVALGVLFRYGSKVIIAFVLVTWSIYPLFFALGPGRGDVVSLVVTSSVYIATDQITKTAFTAWLVKDADNSVYDSLRTE